MSIRGLMVTAAIVAFGAFAPALASATALRSDPGGGLLTGPVTFKNTAADSATLSTGGGNIQCAQAFFDATVNVGTFAGALNTLTFTSCTDTLLAVNVSSCNLHAATVPTVSLVSAAGGGTMTLGHFVMRCATSPTQGCYYTGASATGSYNNAGSSINFPGALISAVSPTTDAVAPGNCGSGGSFMVKFTHIVTAANITLTIAGS